LDLLSEIVWCESSIEYAFDYSVIYKTVRCLCGWIQTMCCFTC